MRIPRLLLLAALLGACRGEPEPVMPKEPVRTPTPRLRPGATTSPVAAIATAASGSPATHAGATPAAAASATVTPTPSAGGATGDVAAEVAPVIEAWRTAWQEKALDRYLAFYAGEFQGDGLDLEGWTAKKRGVFARAGDLQVEVSELEVKPAPEGAMAVFVQTYRSGALSDRGKKTLILRKVEGRWRILRESFRKQS